MPTIDITTDPRMNASVHIWRDEDGHRHIEVDGHPLPCWTDGPIVVEHRHLGAYAEGGFWNAHEDDVYDPAAGKNVVTDIHLTLRLIDGTVTCDDDLTEVRHTPYG